MNNIFVGQMRDYLKLYFKKQTELNNKIEENTERFSPQYAEKENAKVREQQAKTYDEAIAGITEVFEDVRGLLANASWIGVESLTADRLFFENNSPFNLTVNEVKAFIERYNASHNYIMLRMIKDWIDRNNVKTDKHPTGIYTDILVSDLIVLPEDILAIYKQFAEGAIAICNLIYRNTPIMQNPIEIETYADERADWMLEKIGNGLELKEYKARKLVPEAIAHRFDEIELSAEGNPHYYIK